jgi:hypothetical protein
MDKHICDCGECSPVPYEDRCQFETRLHAAEEALFGLLTAVNFQKGRRPGLLPQVLTAMKVAQAALDKLQTEGQV